MEKAHGKLRYVATYLLAKKTTWEGRASQRVCLRNGARPDIGPKSERHLEPEEASPASAELPCAKEPWLSQSPQRRDRQRNPYSFLSFPFLRLLRLASNSLT